jgi:dihydrofolate synthase / folylpolyglutamate synthase
VLPDLEFAELVPGSTVRVGGAREAAAAFLGRPADAEIDVELPGRFELRDGEVRDGAHNADGARWLVERLDAGPYVVVASILGDKDVPAMLAALAAVGDTFVATRSSNARALPADDLAALARQRFAVVEVVPEPVAALARAHELGSRVLVTGSLYLLADLESHEREAVWRV